MYWPSHTCSVTDHSSRAIVRQRILTDFAVESRRVADTDGNGILSKEELVTYVLIDEDLLSDGSFASKERQRDLHQMLVKLVHENDAKMGASTLDLPPTLISARRHKIVHSQY